MFVQPHQQQQTANNRPAGADGSAKRGIGGRTQVFCVLGHPVGHSLSPAMHNRALAAMGIDGVYVAFDVAPEVLRDAVIGLQALGVGGVNCTIPHKEALLPLMDSLSEEAEAIGAVNTIEFREGRRIGHNTDAAGFSEDLADKAGTPAEKWQGAAVVLGAGGSSRAVCLALGRGGATVYLANRSPQRAGELADRLNRRLGREAIHPVEYSEKSLKRHVGEANLLVNTTSVGMSPHTEAMPAVPERAFHSGLFVYDLIYSPRETLLLRTARRCGARGSHGAGMLARQGARSLHLWTGMPVPAALMEQEVLEHLGG